MLTLTGQSGAVCECRKREGRDDSGSQATSGGHGGSDQPVQNQGAGTRDHETETPQHHTGTQGPSKLISL